jgi:hypothetical protein
MAKLRPEAKIREDSAESGSKNESETMRLTSQGNNAPARISPGSRSRSVEDPGRRNRTEGNRFAIVEKPAPLELIFSVRRRSR